MNIVIYFFNQVSMEEVYLTETMEENMNLQTQSNAIQNEEKKMKVNLQKLKTSVANKPKKVVRGGGPSPLKRGKKSKPKLILEWVSIATTTWHATIKNT